MAAYLNSGPDKLSPRPKLRCPACGFMVPLPASTCSSCGVDLRTGYKTPSPKQGWPKHAVLGLKIFILTLVAVFLLRHAPWRHDYLKQNYQAAPLPAERPAEDKRKDIAAAPEAFKVLAEEYPFLLLPYIYVYKAKTSIKDYQGRFKDRTLRIEETAGFSPGTTAAYQMATPAERQRILKELLNQTGGGTNPND